MRKRKAGPPGLFLRFFRWFCHPELKDYIEGDMMELYYERIKNKGKRRADIKFIIDVVLLFRPGIIRLSKNMKYLNTYAMFRNYFKVTFRNLVRHKGYAALNIAGFAAGIAVCIVILLFVSFERSFDNFQPDDLYRLNEVQAFPGMLASQEVALSMSPMGPALKDEFPEIKNFTRVSWFRNYMVYSGSKKAYLGQSFLVDSTFLQMFNFKMIEGNRATALMKPNQAVLTRSAARKIFGDEDPLNKMITYYSRDTMTFMVTGVLKDVPENSQMQFDALYSFSSLKDPTLAENWGGNWLNTYLELQPHADIAALEKKFPAFLKEHMASSEGWKYYTLFLLPYKNVHAGASDIGLDYINYHKFDGKYTDLFFGLALIILVIACINFMNLSTARSAERAKEVGIRKSIGSRRIQLAFQFITESVIMSLIALVIALALVYLMLPSVNSLSQRNLSLDFLLKPWPAILTAGGAVVIGILSGIYPAFYLSGFQPVKVLKSANPDGGSRPVLRNVLVVIQFSSAICLMINSVFIVRQLNFMLSKDPGFDKSNVVDIELNGKSGSNTEELKTELLKNNLIKGVTACQDILGSHLDQSTVEFRGDGPKRFLTATRLIVDPDYLRLYKIPVIYGRDFSESNSARGNEYIINETFAKELLSDEPGRPMSSLIGDRFGFDSTGTIIGIARDFNFNSLHNKIETLFINNNVQYRFSHLSVKIDGSKTAESLACIRSVWDSKYPDQPFRYQFLDDHFNEVYQSDSQVSSIVARLTLLAFIISCLGLFGLASYSAERRVKEVGIRKVFGASVAGIAVMLSKDFIKYVMVASVITLPLAWFIVRQWIRNYAYHIPISLWIFLVSVLASIVIALVTTSYQAVKSASANPVSSLRNE